MVTLILVGAVVVGSVVLYKVVGKSTLEADAKSVLEKAKDEAQKLVDAIKKKL